LAVLLRQPIVLQLLLLFAVPAASFALTNTLGGLGRDYHASERFVAIMGGAAVTAAGVLGSLVVPPLARRAPTRTLYIAVGILGALFTLSLIVLPRTPMLFALAIVGQNVAQSAALTLNNVIALQSLGEDNPFAATQFGLITSAAALPITYMPPADVSCRRRARARGLPGDGVSAAPVVPPPLVARGAGLSGRRGLKRRLRAERRHGVWRFGRSRRLAAVKQARLSADQA
jgi:PAT family beta-lactamase induction signal transducer AmpG